MKMKNLIGRIIAVAALSFAAAAPVWAQLDQYRDYKEVYRDTTVAPIVTDSGSRTELTLDPYRVVTNTFEKNWFVYATAGAHTFRGDYSSYDKFSGTLSPDFGVGIGRWLTPFVALKLEFLNSDSRGYTIYDDYHFGYGDWLGSHNGLQYKRMKTNWFDVNIMASLNLTRLYFGYEGYGTRNRMGQWMLNLGIGDSHRYGYEGNYKTEDLWSGHLELQYSRFLTKEKRASIDLKARGLFYQTNFDHESGMENMAAGKFDSNLGLDLGFTFYLGKKKDSGWGRHIYEQSELEIREREIQILKLKEVEAELRRPATIGTITFFVFYPNNYSGRNDAPIVEGATVNALDYLAGGIFTQKQFVDNDAVASRLRNGASLNGLAFTDLPTEAANQDFAIDYVPRGYEMLQDIPTSLSLDAADMNAFKDRSGFYYAPIWDGLHTWNYRIDDATLRQQLLSGTNYLETNSFGLNAHSGLETVRTRMGVDGNDELVSFADVYAALKSNEGYISRFSDEATVGRIKEILDKGIILLIQVEGLATSQDNWSGADAARVGEERNTALSRNRAQTVINWLTADESMKDVSSQIYLVNSMNNGIRTVNDPSTRGLNAKLNRSVKVRIQYMID